MADSNRLLGERIGADVLWLRATGTSGEVTLRVTEEPDQPALVRWGRWSLSHVERNAPASMVNALRVNDSDSPASVAELRSSIERALHRADPTVSVTLLRRTALGQVLPRWPPWTRTQSREDDAFHWPADPELLALSLGLRRLLKREAAGAEDLAQDASALATAGYSTRLVIGRHPTLLVASDSKILERAEAAELALDTRGRDASDAVSWLGSALGYPPCCVRRFVELEARDDMALLAVSLPPPDAEPVSPLGAIILGPMSLVSHMPCRSDCVPTAELARTLLAELDHEHAGFARAWWRSAASVQAIDRDGHGWALRASGNLAGGASVASAMRIVATKRRDEPIFVPHPELAGQELCRDGGTLVIAGRAQADLFADHRGI